MIDKYFTMGVSVLVYFLILIAMCVIGGVFVSCVNAFRDAKHYKRESEMLHAKLDLVCIERNELRNQLAIAAGDLQRKRVSSNWVRDCISDDYRAKQRKAETVIRNYRKQIEQEKNK